MDNQPIVMKTTPPRRQIKVLVKALLRLRQAPEVRPEKVHPLSKAIRNNAYRVDCRKLADCLITSLLLGLIR